MHTGQAECFCPVSSVHISNLWNGQEAISRTRGLITDSVFGCKLSELLGRVLRTVVTDDRIWDTVSCNVLLQFVNYYL